MSRLLAAVVWLLSLCAFLFAGFVFYAVPGLSGSGRDLSTLNAWGIAAGIAAIMIGIGAAYGGYVLWRR